MKTSNSLPDKTQGVSEKPKRVKKATNKQVAALSLPTDYRKLTREERRDVRNEYVKLQDGKCFYCKYSLSLDPPKTILDKPIKWEYFPGGIHFLDYPVHLQHDHKTGLTEGAVHSYCNAVMWQYERR